jgi:hypothetical protein
MELIKKHALNELFELNTPVIQKKIIKCMNEQISDFDGIGFIYGFEEIKNNNTKYNFEIKIGRTKRNVYNQMVTRSLKRINEWKGNELFSLRTNHNIKLEKFVLLFFNFVKINFTTGERCGKQEWFHFDNIEINNKKITYEKINQIIIQINEMKNEIFDNENIINENIINENIINENIINENIINENIINENTKKNDNKKFLLINEKKEIQNIIAKCYWSKDYFSSPNKCRFYELFNKCLKNDINGSIIPLNTQMHLKNIMHEHPGCKYIKVAPRRELFNNIQLYMIN